MLCVPQKCITYHTTDPKYEWHCPKGYKLSRGKYSYRGKKGHRDYVCKAKKEVHPDYHCPKVMMTQTDDGRHIRLNHRPPVCVRRGMSCTSTSASATRRCPPGSSTRRATATKSHGAIHRRHLRDV